MYTLSHGVALTALGHAKLQASAIQSKNDLTTQFFFSCKNELNYFSCVTGEADVERG